MIAHVPSIATFPTAEQIATAVVAAARLTGDDPVEVLTVTTGFHARHLAFAALREAFPRATAKAIAAALTYSVPDSAVSMLDSAQRASWWREDWVDDVVGAIVSERYGAQAR